MPKRLSDITHAYERTSADLEAAQEELTAAVERAGVKCNAAGRAHRRVAGELADYLKAHPDEVVIANDFGYHIDGDQIVRRPVYWAHHVWIEDTEPSPRYQVPTDDSTAERVLAAACALGEPDGEPITMGSQED